MKKLSQILLLSIAFMALLLSCNQNAPSSDPEQNPQEVNKEQQDPNKNNGGENGGNSSDPSTPPQGEYICSTHQVNRYYKISELSLKEEILKKDNNEGYPLTVAFVTKEFYGYRTPQVNLSKFAKCVEKFGDTASKMTFPEAIDVGFALSAFITDVRVTSAEAFDANHPAGASLTDIVEVQYLTAYPSIKRNYDPTGLEGLIEPNVDYSDPRYGVQRISKSLDKVSPEELAMVYLAPDNAVIDPQDAQHKNTLYRLRFTKAPSNAVQTITVTITTDEGVYTATQKVAFL